MDVPSGAEWIAFSCFSSLAVGAPLLILLLLRKGRRRLWKRGVASAVAQGVHETNLPGKWTRYSHIGGSVRENHVDKG